MGDTPHFGVGNPYFETIFSETVHGFKVQRFRLDSDED